MNVVRTVQKFGRKSSVLDRSIFLSGTAGVSRKYGASAKSGRYRGTAPIKNPTYHLDGTISGNELVDIVNGYNFTINNKDFDSDTYGGIPFKSLATISPPSSGDANTDVTIDWHINYVPMQDNSTITPV